MELIIIVSFLLFIIEINFLFSLINKTNNIDSFISGLTEETKLSTIKSPAFKELRYELLSSLYKTRYNLKINIIILIGLILLLNISYFYYEKEKIRIHNNIEKSELFNEYQKEIDELNTYYFKQTNLKNNIIDSLINKIKRKNLEIDSINYRIKLVNRKLKEKELEIIKIRKHSE